MPALRHRRLAAAASTHTLVDPAGSHRPSVASPRAARCLEPADPGAAARSVRVRGFTGPWYMTRYGYLTISRDGR